MGMILQSMVMMGNKLNNHILMKREKENNHGFIQYINIDRRPCIIFVWIYEMGMKGAATATIAGQGVTVLPYIDRK